MVEIDTTARDQVPTSASARVKVTNFQYKDSLNVRPSIYSGIAEATFTWQRGKWAMTKFTIGAGTPNAHSWQGLYVTDAYANIEQPGSDKQNEIVVNENTAISNVRRLVTAELAYVSRNQNTCGTMRNLIREGFIEEAFASGDVGGYRLSITDVGNMCGVLAVPRTFSVTGIRSFYAPVADGFIRYSTDGSFPKDTSPRLQ
jgi:hypothetical protein